VTSFHRLGLADRLLVGSALLAVAAGVGAAATGALRGYERDSVDSRFAIRGTEHAPGDIVVVAVDDRTFDELGVQWPFPRSLHADLVDAMRRAGARVLAYDVQFTEQTVPEEDSALIEAVEEQGRVVLAATETNSRGESAVFGGPEVLEQIGALAGHSGLPPDEGDVLRRLPYATEGLETFAVATVTAERGRPPQRPAGDTPWIDYHGPPGSFTTVSFSQALRARRNDSRFRGRTVVIGASAPSLHDVHPTPTTGDGLMSGPEIQANAISTARRGFPLRSAPEPIGYGFVVAMALLPAALGRRRRARSTLLLATAGLAGYLVAAQVGFQAGIVLPVAAPAFAWALSAAGAAATRYAMGSVERQRIRDSFRRFVPEAVVDATLERAGGGSPRLGGVRLESTVMFSDLRGFTSFGEQRSPEQVIEVLNRYLTRMSAAILDEGGTLVAYMGDGIMAVFGAPVPADGHADAALRAARRMLAELDAFNDELVAEGICDRFRMGIGLNSGPVMSGNVGSERRLEYTALGDTTNTAARLEQMTKKLGRQLVLSDSTRALLTTEPDDLEPLGEFPVRGREHGIVVWTVRGS
jgi:adenylate cyclase